MVEIGLGPVDMDQIKELNPRFHQYLNRQMTNKVGWEMRTRASLKVGSFAICCMGTNPTTKSPMMAIAKVAELDATAFNGEEGSAVLTDGHNKWSADYQYIAAISGN